MSWFIWILGIALIVVTMTLIAVLLHMDRIITEEEEKRAARDGYKPEAGKPIMPAELSTYWSTVINGEDGGKQ